MHDCTRNYINGEWVKRVAQELGGKAADGPWPGDPDDPETQIGPVISEAQYHKIQDLIEAVNIANDTIHGLQDFLEVKAVMGA